MKKNSQGKSQGTLNEYLAGLRRNPKRLQSKFFYDDEGARLFEEICKLEEYYPTRTETAILRERAGEIAEMAGERAAIVDLGSGNSGKIRILLERLRDPSSYFPVEISRKQLVRSCRELQADYPELSIFPICADYSNGLSLPSIPARSRKTILFFPGSTLGNFEPIEALGFLLKLARLAGKGAGLLIGIDLKKDEDILNAAYDDAAGVTADFNLNILARANRDFAADFRLDQFRHRARYDSVHGRVVMQLESLREQEVRIGGEIISFSRDELITTEYSYKYTVAEFRGLASLAGFTPETFWTDPAELFSLHYLEVA